MKVSNSMQNFIKKDGSIPDLYNNIYLKMSQVQRFSVTFWILSHFQMVRKQLSDYLTKQNL